LYKQQQKLSAKELYDVIKASNFYHSEGIIDSRTIKNESGKKLNEKCKKEKKLK